MTADEIAMAIRTGSSTDRGFPAPGELFLNTETRKLEVGDGSGWWPRTSDRSRT
jgi:hypothetical protein